MAKEDVPPGWVKQVENWPHGVPGGVLSVWLAYENQDGSGEDIGYAVGMHGPTLSQNHLFTWDMFGPGLGNPWPDWALRLKYNSDRSIEQNQGRPPE